MQEIIFIADLIACSTCFWNHYAHHQELESVVQMVAAFGIWCFGFKLSVWCRAEGYVSDLRAAARKPDTLIGLSTYPFLLWRKLRFLVEISDTL